MINLDDSVDTMKNYSTYPGSFYSKCAVINPEMNYDFAGKEFGEKVRQSVLFITENDGPYLIHCKEGKDRTGILCAILEYFAGAAADDVNRDYMTTYYNYYNVQPEDAAYSIILNNNFVKTLSNLFEVDDLEEADLHSACWRQRSGNLRPGPEGDSYDQKIQGNKGKIYREDLWSGQAGLCYVRQ